MRLPVLHGVIKRRMLVNFRVEAEVMRRFLPAPFEPKLHAGYAIAGICLIRLEEIRPTGFPSWLGLTSENAAHRVAVEWTAEDGARQEGVFIARRDTSSRLSHFAGGRVFPGEHHLAKFKVSDDGAHVELEMQSRADDLRIELSGVDAEALPATSCFRSLQAASRFFENGSLGYSLSRDASRLDGIHLRTDEWRVRPLSVTRVYSTFFEDRARFPSGSVTFDHALIMRDIVHEWCAADDMLLARDSALLPS